MSKLTAIICTFDRYDLTLDCLDSLLPGKRTKAEKSDTSLLVVDNTPPARRRSVKWPKGVQIEFCDVAGLSHARNAGIKASDSELIAFLDDDAIARPDWATQTINFFEKHDDALAVGGAIEPLFDGCDRPLWLDDKLAAYLSCLDYGPDCRPLRDGEYIVGANMAFRRTVFDRYGLFDVSLGRQGNIGLLSNEEIGLLSKIKAFTYFDPAIHIRHRIPPARTQQAWFRRRVVWQAISDYMTGITEPSAKVEAAWRQCVVAAPADQRTLALLDTPCESAESFHRQLRAVYLHTQWSLSGFEDAGTA